jgi:hypothetical protein
MSDTAARTYRFAPLDRAGWLLGLGAMQCIALGAGIFGAGAMLQAHANAVAVLVPVVLGTAFAFGSWDGRSCHEWLPIALRHAFAVLTRRNQWVAPIPLLGGPSTAAPLPPLMRGLELVDAGPATWAPASPRVGVVRDRRERTLSASVRVRGREFSLVERSEQERLIQQWGDVLGAFCSERRAVVSIRVSEFASHGASDAATRPTNESGNAEAMVAYAELVATAGPLEVRHEIVLTVTVDLRRVRASASETAEAAGIATLVDELRLLSVRLETAGLGASAPLSPTDVAAALRDRLDPTSVTTARRRLFGTLASAAGLTSSRSFGPLALRSEWDSMRVDGSLHRTYWIAEWPRLDVPPNWMETFLLHAAGTRTISIQYEPVPPSRAQRRVDRDSTRLAADEEQRARTGFRIGARHRRAQAAVLERESELVAGYSEFEFAGFVTVTATDRESLIASCAEYEQAAAQVGLELRALDAQHDAALLCALPVGRGLARRRL